MPTLTANVPEGMRALPRWVCAQDGSKRPMQCTSHRAASVSKPDTWGDFDEAEQAVASGAYPWAGFVFAGDGLVGIDIDHAFGDDGMPSEEAMEAVLACRSYTELSRSGSGFHIVCRGDLPFPGRANGRGWEAYREGRYFLLTGRTVLFGELRDAQDGIDAVLAKHFADAPRPGSGRGRGNPRIWEPSWEVDAATRTVGASWPPVGSGSRHLAMVSLCGQLHGCGASKEAMLAWALEANAAYMEPPLPEEEVAQVAESVARYRR